MNAGLGGVTVCSSAFAWKRCRRGLSTSPSSSRIFAREGLGNPASSSVEQHEEACCASHEKDAKQINRRQVMRRTGVAFVSATVLPTTQGLTTREALATTDEPGERPEEWVLSAGLSTLVVRSDGTLELWGNGHASPQSFDVTLPHSASKSKASLLPPSETSPGASLALQWPGGTQLVVWPASGDKSVDDSRHLFTWAAGLEEGFFLEISVPSKVDIHGNMELAEMSVDLQSGGRWYGGAHLLRQLWPLDRTQWEIGPMYPFDHGPNGLGSVVGAHWVSSRGTLVAVDPTTPMLHAGLNAPVQQRSRVDPRYFGVGIQHLTQEALPYEDGVASGNQKVPNNGDGKLRIQARSTWEDDRVLHPWQAIGTPESARMQRRAFNEGKVVDATNGGQRHIDPLDDRCVLRIAIAASLDVRTATLSALKSLPSPQVAPPSVVFNRSTWTTWATSHADVVQADVLALGKAVIDNGYRPGVLEIDDRWQSRYGDLEFDSVKFPDPKGMIEQLHKEGFLVTVWVMPFLQEGSAACAEARRLGHLVEGGDPPSLVREVSVGGPGERLGSAVKILVDQYDWPPGHWAGGGGGGTLQSGQLRWWGTQPVRAIDLTSDAAVDWFVARLKALQQRAGLDGFKFDAGEPCFLPRGAVTSRPLKYPGEYTQLWVNRVVSQFSISEVRSAMGTTEYRGLVRMGDRDTVWGVDNGLQSLIPALLTSSVLGYPFCLPDMIGGNAYWGQFPDTELMVRWAQVSALMPAVQWSIPPWEVSDEASDACKIADAMRDDVLLPRINDLFENAAANLTPICRPLWWLDPLDKETFNIDDQFLIGDDVLVAPVVVKGARNRRVYLPAGVWSEYKGQENIAGRCWVEVEAPLMKLPVFIRSSVSV